MKASTGSIGALRVRRMIDVHGAFLRRTDWSGADLRDANVSGADMSHAILRGADLEGTNLTGTILRGADLRDAKNLTAEQLGTALIDDATRLPDYLSPLDLPRSRPEGTV